ncbi:MAG: OPT/YSL family transporter [Candidatus Omnitrophica bacterium]|nr:OPT/YSL family transporter [Candidatus Omnitrophota bacterium]MCM8776736.1 OPT/YSL family transporter [Candidatus Omnitrophota bacterium]
MAEEKREIDAHLEPERVEQFQEGFSIRTIIAALFIGFIMLPGAIYLGLITGGGIAGAAQWVTVILLVEIAKRSFIELKKQEVYIIYILAASLVSAGLVLGTAGLTLQGGAFSDLIWKQYLIQSPYAQSFNLHRYMPSWAVPPAGSEAILKRTFLHRAWAVPILLLIIHNVLFRINKFTLGYTVFRLTSDKEKLSFPMAPVASEGAIALAEVSGKKETWRWRIFSISAMIGVIFGAFYVVIPTVTGLLMTKPFQLLPIPWVDFTSKMGDMFPSSMLGFMTELGVIFTGFVLPFWVVTGSFIGSILAKTVGNPILYKAGIIKNWQPGMTAIPANVATNLDFWINATIAGGIVVAVIGIVTMVKVFLRRKKEIGKGEVYEEKLPEGRGDYPVYVAIILWVLSTAIYIAICKILVPKFPTLLFVFFGFILTPFLTYTSARMFGITGVAGGISFPMVREGTFILSGYKGVDIWFAPVPYFNHGRATEEFKQLELTRTKFTSWYKAEFTALVIMLFCSFLFWSIIWRMAPIPSSTYPYVQKMWPMDAMFQALWATSTVEGGRSWMIEAIKFKYIFNSSLIGFVLYFILLFFKAPVSLFYGIIGGMSMLPHMALPMFLGALLGRFYFAKKVGPNWRRYTPIILAGYSCGMGLVGMVSIAVALIAKTVFQIIF